MPLRFVVRMMRSLWWAQVAGVCLAVLFLLVSGSAPFTQQIALDVAPFARCRMSGPHSDVNPGAGAQRSDLRVLNDATTDTLYMAQLPAENGAASVHFAFPWTITADTIILLGSGDQSPATFEMSVRDGHGAWQSFGPREWASRDQVPPIDVRNGPLPMDELRLDFHGAPQVTLNCLEVYAALPRWKAWGLFLGLTVLLPAACGWAAVLSLLALGRVLTRRAEIDGLGRAMASGVLAHLAAAGIWLALPRSAVADALFVGWIVLPAGCEGVRLARRLAERAIQPDDRLTLFLLGATAVTVIAVMIDTNLVAPRRMMPVDYLLPQIGAHRLAAGVGLDAEFAARPWGVQVLFAPWDHLLGRFSYWGYLGVLSGLNALVLIPASLFARRWGWGDGVAVAVGVILLPLHFDFNAVGQRPISAAYCLLFLYWLLPERVDRCWLLAGLAELVAIACHPGAAFALPGVLVYAVWFAPPRRGITTAFRMLAVPAVGYALWLLAMRCSFPDARNSLLYYPLMVSFEPFDSTKGLVEIVRDLPAAQWRQLALNRLSHLKYYLHTDPLSDPVIDRFRWISLPNVFGVCLLVLAIRRFRELCRDRLCLGLAVLGPLAVHHLYLGQAHAQFHITPVPFYALGILAAGAWLYWPSPESRSWLDVGLAAAATLEVFLRQCYPWYVAVMHPEGRGTPPLDLLGFLSNDALSHASLPLLLPLCWTALACRALKCIPGTASPAGQ